MIWIHDCPDTAPREIASGDSCPVCGMGEHVDRKKQRDLDAEWIPDRVLSRAPPPEESATIKGNSLYISKLEDAAEMLWTVIANVSEGDWRKQSQDWQDAAARWRDNYFAALTYKSLPASPPTSAEPISPAGDTMNEEIRTLAAATKDEFYKTHFAALTEMPMPAGEADATPIVDAHAEAQPAECGLSELADSYNELLDIARATEIDRNRLMRIEKMRDDELAVVREKHGNALIRAEAAERELAKLQAFVREAALELPAEPIFHSGHWPLEKVSALTKHAVKLRQFASAKLAAAKQTIELKDAEVARLGACLDNLRKFQAVELDTEHGKRVGLTYCGTDIGGPRCSVDDNPYELAEAMEKWLHEKIDAARSQPSAAKAVNPLDHEQTR